MRLKTCKTCAEQFAPTRPLQQVCGAVCAMKLARKKTEQAHKKEKRKEASETRKRLDAMQTKPQLLKKAQAAFNGFIRARDERKPCVSCGAPLNLDKLGGAFDCGHYRSVGSSPHLRFDERNAHGQCKHCNRYLSGNHVAYRQGLIERIGLAQVEALEADQTIRKYTKDELERMAVEYRSRAIAKKK